MAVVEFNIDFMGLKFCKADFCCNIEFFAHPIGASIFSNRRLDLNIFP